MISRLIFLVCVLVLPLHSFANDGLRLGIMDFPPFYTVADKNEVGGTFLPVLEGITQEAGYAYKITGYPSRRLFKLLAEGGVDMFVGIKGIPIYEGKVLYSRFPVELIEMAVFSKGPLDQIESIYDLSGQKLITIAGYGYGPFRKNFLDNPEYQVDVIDAFTHQSALRMLNAGRADLMLHYSGPVSSYLEAYPIPEVQKKVIQRIEAHIIVSKATPEATEVLQELERAYFRLVTRGAVDPVVAKSKIVVR